MQDHAVVFEAEAAGQLGVGGHLLLVDLAVGEDRGDLLGQRVRVGDVALVELEVHLQRLVGDAGEAGEIEGFRFVDFRFHAPECTCTDQRAQRNVA